MTKPQTVKEIADGILVFLKNNNLEETLPQLIDYLMEGAELSVVNIYSPKSLTGTEKKSAEKFVRQLIGENPKEVRFNTDNTLIDGLKVSYKDKLWDFSIKGQIGQLIKS